jgi:hypothetical protein
MLAFLSVPAAVGSLRVADAVGLAVDRGIIDDGVYFRLSNTFYAALGVRFSSSELTAGYAFRLVPDPASQTVAPFHIADLRYAYTTPRWSLLLSESVGVGKQVFLGTGRASPLVGITSGPAQSQAGPTLAVPSTVESSFVPGALTLPVVIQRADASLGYRLDRNWSSSLALGYSIFGGLTRDAQRDLALLHTLTANATAEYRLSSRTDLDTSLQLARGWNSRDERYALLVLSETWQYEWTKRTKLDVGAGLSVREVEEPMGPIVIVTTPVGALGIQHTLRARDLTGVLRFTVTYLPLVDAITARLQNRLTALASATLNYDDLYAGVGVALSQSVPTNDPTSVRYVNANVFSGYRFNTWLGASLSAQVTRQWFGVSGDDRAGFAASGITWGIYGGLDATYSVQRF